MAYLEFVIPARSWSSTEKEILFALMAQIGFEGFVEGEDDIQAFINEEAYVPEALNQLIDELAGLNIKVQYRFHRTEDQNWNEEWEKKFDPASNDLECTLVIEPKMSFGTGHHHTTKLMIREMGNHLLEEKKILDMGCGTGVLGIYACKKGAARVLGVDIDQWAYENSLENIKRNGVTAMEVRLGDVSVLYKDKFNMILANITRNTLVRDMSVYTEHLLDQGLMVISGILAEDVQFVLNEAYKCDLKHLSTGEESNWISLTFINAEP